MTEPTPVEVIEAALQERLDAACPDFWPDLGSWAEDAVAALTAAGYVIKQHDLLEEILSLLKPLMDEDFCMPFPSAWELCTHTRALTGAGEQLDGEQLHARLRIAYDRAARR